MGGKLHAFGGTNARLGKGDFLVAEADESDASFLYLQPALAVITNIDADHMDTYGHDYARLKQAFVDFIHRMPFYGTAILCLDHPHVHLHRDPAVELGVEGAAPADEARVGDVNGDGRLDIVVKPYNWETPRADLWLNLK